MDEQLIAGGHRLEEQLRELKQNIDFISNELNELGKFLENISFMEKSKENSIISSLGKGLYVKASLEEKNIFVLSKNF